MIESLLRRCTDTEIDISYVDTHGAGGVGFALTELLEFRLPPPDSPSIPKEDRTLVNHSMEE